MKRTILTFLVVALVALFSQSVQAKIILPAVLSDHMVLQQQSTVKLWGEATPNKKVTVVTSWNKKKYVTQADNTGKWLVEVVTTTAGGPYEITISDGEKLTLQDVLLGEVWLCSGQSNMEMPMTGFGGQPIEGSNDVIASALESTPIRMITIEKATTRMPIDSCKGNWQVNTPQAVASTSATAYFFARYLNKVLQVPVGIVVSSWGGTAVEAWMSRESLRPFANEVDLSHLDTNKDYNLYGAGCTLYNAMLYPLRNLHIKGMIWYQGESNHNQPELYRRLMPAFVQDARQLFNTGEFPFYYVQIAPYVYEGLNQTLGAELRESQMYGLQDIPNSGMAVTMDVASSAYQIHPEQKSEVGERLAWWALAKTYSRSGFSYSGPIYNRMEAKDGKIYVNFNYADNGLVISDYTRNGFDIAGDDKVFYPAQVQIISGNSIAVSSPQVKNPVAVRYAFRNYVVGTLFNGFGLPASSFRTDGWSDATLAQ